MCRGHAVGTSSDVETGSSAVKESETASGRTGPLLALFGKG